MITRKKLQLSILLMIGIVLLVNIIANKYFLRLDFTADQRYSLSNATENILTTLTDPVTITAYFSEDLPPNVEQVRRDFRDMLVEYSNSSGGQIVYEFVNPSENQESEMKAQQNGISPIMINVRERDQMKQQRAYLGAIVQLGENKEVIPFVQPGAAMEYALSSNIKKLSVTEKPKIALIRGHGEPGIAALQQLNTSLSIMYTVDEVELSDTSNISPEYMTAVIIAPKDTIPEFHFNYLDEFLNRGGRLLLALNRVEGNFSTTSGEKVFTGLPEWLAQKGIEIEENFVLDVNCSNIMVRQQQGMFVMNTPVNFPYLPIITNFADHPITDGLESVLLPFVSSVRFNTQDTTLNMVPLLVTSEKSGIQPPPVYFDISKQWANNDFNQSSVPVAFAIDGNIAGNMDSKMVVFGDGDFAVNGEGQSAQQLQPDNVSLMVNAIDWLSDDTGLIELRTKGVTSRPIDVQLEDGTKTLVKYINFLLPILLIVVYGIFRFNLKRKLRNNLMSVDYV